MNQPIRQTVAELAPVAYADTIKRLDIDPSTDMSRSNSCSHLSLNLLHLLNERGISARRELHQTPEGFWHYVIAHTDIAATPSSSDIITDLNPWQYSDNAQQFGPLHGERTSMEQLLAEAGSPDWFISLRGLETITKTHSEKLTPFSK